MPSRRRHCASQAAWMIAVVCAAAAGCLGPNRPGLTENVAAPAALTAEAPAGSETPAVAPEGAPVAAEAPARPPARQDKAVETQSNAGFVVLPAVQPRVLTAAPAVSGVQQAGFQENGSQPPTLPEPRTIGPELEPAKPRPTEDKSSSSTSSTEAKEVPIVDVAQPDPTAPHCFAERCKECSWVKKYLTKEVPVKDAPKEMHLAASPAYIIRPPDILLVESPRALPDQPIGGEHLVRADGTIHLGLYGTVRVAGLTVEQAKEAIQKHLSTIIREPQVNVDVYAYNSQFYYIVYDGAGYGEAVVRLNYTGSETVLDAIALIGGIPQVSSKKLIWVSRPTHDPKHALILPVDWEAIVKCGETATNYQIFPGDRLYIQSERIQALDGVIAKIVSPIERVLSLTLLTALNLTRWQNLGRNPGLQRAFPGSNVVITTNGGGGGGGGGF